MNKVEKDSLTKRPNALVAEAKAIREALKERNEKLREGLGMKQRIAELRKCVGEADWQRIMQGREASV
jgi:hypothetical protein